MHRLPFNEYLANHGKYDRDEHETECQAFGHINLRVNEPANPLIWRVLNWMSAIIPLHKFKNSTHGFPYDITAVRAMA